MSARGRDDRIGKRFRDPAGKTGICTDVLGRTAYLRPERGGREWPVPLADIEPVTEDAQDSDALSEKLSAVNKRSRGEL
ncbi:hypothetical protein GCM10010307_43550 [Streptomyces vastus]|uniref:DUF397 domain-containing protein n=1 Tax=Streptomyces vastus TaxID=285451 RepID=A0ABN3R2N4_9ACTN